MEQLLDEHLENEESTTSDGAEGNDGDEKASTSLLLYR
jgi:hypothetical protein